MAANYNSKKKADLEALLKERGLPHSGNKPDLVARLQEDDVKKSAETGAEPTAPAPAGDEDKIDWDDEETHTATSNLAAAQATDDPAHKAALEAGGVGRVANPVAVPNQVEDEANEPGKTTDTVVTLPDPADAKTGEDSKEKSAEDAEAKKMAYEEKFTAHLKASEEEKEAEQRKRRAERFGIKVDDEAKKLEERAQKFGTSGEKNEKLLKALDGPLVEHRERHDRKRGRDRGDVGRGGVQKRVDSRRRDDRPRGPAKSQHREQDRAAMAARAARFARQS